MLNDCACGEPLFDYMEMCPRCGAANPLHAKSDDGPRGRVIVQGILDDVAGWFHRKHDDVSMHIYTHGPGGK
jgi:hypothetical protein